MNIQLLQGSFSNSEGIELLTQLIQVKIKFHENKIHNTHNEEDIKMREKRIRQLQDDLKKVRDYIQSNGNIIALESTILINP